MKYEEHCLLNHVGSSQSMESSPVMKLYKLSVKKRGLYYDPSIGDGDCSAYRGVTNANVYGFTKAIGKEEDKGHVTKRMGNQLQALVRDWRGKKTSDGKTISGKGRLTKNRIDLS